MNLSRSLVGVARQSGVARNGQLLRPFLHPSAARRRTYADSVSSTSSASQHIDGNQATEVGGGVPEHVFSYHLV